MHIYLINSEPVRSEPDHGESFSDLPGESSLLPLGRAPRSSQRNVGVANLGVGRARGVPADARQPAGLEPARAAHIRRRIQSSAYETPEVLYAVARRLLDSGDL
jgi:hypothetical protein